MNKHKGFTLFELMLVIMLMGLLVSSVKFPSLGQEPFDQVDQQSKKVAALINLASEYAVLNNALLGFSVTESSYIFLMFDGKKWNRIEEAPFTENELEPDIKIELMLDGLEWQSQNLLSAVEWIDEEALEQSSEQTEEEKKLSFPQIFILSSGEVSPFDLNISYDNGFDTPITFKVRGEFVAPVLVLDPKQIAEL
ncbi:type II secretion system protein GspH [Psychrosphaera saromensis]|uniref:Type II secretion system protein GspH n=1 Tax=Psychrosphaera saromensis TaxID=716813 RepID=A0A2S7USK5_9GAMM|nr:prepilin-type N-terminal cleavage/methylation domain-containing protein [Psychrosphaera saromensis]PQJ52917.1 type II secretion system protein GspH [Psychrosphaera saromensis]GHB77924.1 type II secretion system protein GspH [Psychrosphaera saromensis]GLQ12928.1 type II secretion system protein GspH [Psychrosphaera saromensis]